MPYAKGIVDRVQSQIDSKLSCNSRLMNIMDILVRENIAYFIEASPDVFVVDPDNRSTSGIDWFKSHQKIAKIHEAGAIEAALGFVPKAGDPPEKLLQVKSVAFELPSQSAARELVLDVMRTMVKAAGGHSLP